MPSFRCKFCNIAIPTTFDTYRSQTPSFNSAQWRTTLKPSFSDNPFPDLKEDGILVEFFKCPECNKVSVKISGEGTQYPPNYSSWFYPSSSAKQYPDYVPLPIRTDYEEAYNILNLSPKSSATLSRRCIQGMIRDVHKVQETTLYKEIDAIKEMIDSRTYEALHALRQLGNIGA